MEDGTGDGAAWSWEGEKGCGVSICWYVRTLGIATKRLDNPEVLCWLSSCCEGATEGGLKIICLEVPGCWSSTTTKEVGCADDNEGPDGCCTFTITVKGCPVVVCWGCTTAIESGWVSGMVTTYSRPAVDCKVSGSCYVVTSLFVVTCLLRSSALYCISLRSFTVLFLKVKKSLSSRCSICWNWSKTGSADVVAVATGGCRRLGLVLEGWWVTSDAMLISISDSVSLYVSGTEAEAAAAEGLWGDLNAEDLETPFLLMWPRKLLKLQLKMAVHLEMFATTRPASWPKEQLELFSTASWRSIQWQETHHKIRFFACSYCLLEKNLRLFNFSDTYENRYWFYHHGCLLLLE